MVHRLQNSLRGVEEEVSSGIVTQRKVRNVEKVKPKSERHLDFRLRSSCTIHNSHLIHLGIYLLTFNTKALSLTFLSGPDHA